MASVYENEEKSKLLLFLKASTLVNIYVLKFLIKTPQEENGNI